MFPTVIKIFKTESKHYNLHFILFAVLSLVVVVGVGAQQSKKSLLILHLVWFTLLNYIVQM